MIERYKELLNERQSRQRHRTNKNKIKREIENKKTQTPRKMKERKKEKRQNKRTEQSNSATCYPTQDENNLNSIPQANTLPQDEIKSCHIEHEVPSHTHPHTHTD